MKLDVVTLCEKVKNALDCVCSLDANCRRGSHSNRWWTQTILQKLMSIPNPKRRQFCCPSYKKGKVAGEWLYDFVMYTVNEQQNLCRIDIALESEWSSRLGDLQYDFEKLLIARASLKVFVCCSVKGLEEMITDGIRVFGCGEDVYLIATYTNLKGGQWGFRYCVYEDACLIPYEESKLGK